MAGTGLNASNISITAVDVYWRREHRALFDVSGLVDPDGTYFDIFDTDGATARVWYDLDGVGTPPATPAGGRLIPVSNATGDISSVIATATAAAIDGDSKFSAAATTSTIQVDGADVGRVSDPVDGDSGVVITVCYTGQNLGLGLLEGEPSPALEPSNFDVTSHQTGVTILAKLIQGFAGNVETVLLETSKSRLTELYSIYGEEFTPGGGTSVSGVGTGTIGRNIATYGARLEFVPRTALGPELSYQVTFRNAVPTPGSLVFSGENPRTLTVTWDALPDLGATRNKLDFFVIGDISQTGVL